MKHHLVNLLYIQSKLYEIFEEEEIDYDEDTFDNFGVVLDIIGFPKDNSSQYDYDGQLGTPFDSSKGKLMDNDLFSRDYLYQHFSEFISDSTENVGDDETLIKEQFTHFVNWLYKELENIKEEKRKFPDIGQN